MPCYKPITGYVGNYITHNGKPKLVFNPAKAAIPLTPMDLPCGRCIGCRLGKSREWAIRCVHEAQMHEENIYITLTYDELHIPEFGSLLKSDFNTFIQDFRNEYRSKKIRYYMAGEYGSKCPKHDVKDCPECGKIQRPHYHAIIFGHEFADTYFWNTRNGHDVYRSPTLEKLWPHGNSEIGSVSFQSAAYVARYIMKKQTGERAKAHYGQRLPEYTHMSLRPGIGFSWYKKYKNDIFPDDTCITPEGKEIPAPRYYRRLLEAEDPKLYEELKKRRVEKAIANTDNSPERLEAREKCQQAKLNRLKRTL